jgi:hypothetical protein
MRSPDGRRTLLKKLWGYIPRGLKVPIRVALAVVKGDIRIVVTGAQNIEQDSFEVVLADDLESMRTRCCYRGVILERQQSPVVSLFADPTFANLGVLPPNRAYPEFYTVRFRGRSLRWYPDSRVWPPTLDSYILVQEVLRTWTDSDTRVWEVGTGSGIIGLHLAVLSSCTDALLTDVDAFAIEQARANAALFPEGVALLRVERFPPASPPSSPYDLLVSNPPYFPPGFLGLASFEHQATDEYDLTSSLIALGPSYARRVVFGFSSVLLAQVNGQLDNLPRRGLQWRILAKQRLPLTLLEGGKPADLPPGVFRDGPNPLFSDTLWHDFYVCEIKALN